MKRFLLWFPLILALMAHPYAVMASTVSGLDSLDLQGLEDYLNSSLSGDGPTFTDIVEAMVSGDFGGLLSMAGSRIRQALVGEIQENGTELRKMLLLIIFSSLYLQFATTFIEDRGPGQIGFLIAYLMMAALVLTAFQSAFGIAEAVLSQILTFMGLLLPVFFVVVAYAGGTVTAVSFYELMLIVVTAVEWVMTNLFLPLTEVYLVLLLVNSLSEEDFLSRLAALVRRLVEWGMKTLMAVVIGMNVIQSMTLPLVDSVKNQTARKLVSAIPWIGKGTDILTNVVLGTGALLKAGVGTAGMVVVILICLVPLVKLGVLIFLYHGAAALAQPVADRRLLACVAGAGEGCRVLFGLVLYTMVLFLISLAILCSASNLNYTAG